MESLAYQIARVCCMDYDVTKIEVKVEKPSALLNAGRVSVILFRSRDDFTKKDAIIDNHLEERKNRFLSGIEGTDCLAIEDLDAHCIIGLNPVERRRKQNIRFSIMIFADLEAAALTDSKVYTYNYHSLSEMALELVEASSYRTIEALAGCLAEACLCKFQIGRVIVRIEKPNALSFADYAGIEVDRRRSEITSLIPEYDVHDMESRRKTTIVYIGLGSNLGNRAENIRMALHILTLEYAAGHLLDTSFLYETQPVSTIEQPLFLNAACKIETHLQPEELLDILKIIEKRLGREHTEIGMKPVSDEPRPIDLDILLYGHEEYASEKLKIPHPRLHERLFVLRPLCDIAQHVEHPKFQCTLEHFLASFGETMEFPRVMPLTRDPQDLVYWPRHTLLMGILNITPDSFSDGGLYMNIDDAMAHVRRIVDDGADCIDIGGMSTRPDSEEIDETEELARVIPVIRKIRELGFRIPLSIDTFRAKVAREAILAGANWINDISGGNRDSLMLKTMAELDVPVCLMHMRGNSKTMMQLVGYEHDDVVRVVRSELFDCVQRALSVGVKRWHIIIDPGIGFAKFGQQNTRLLRELPQLMEKELKGFPLLVGPSRKDFIRRILERSDPQQSVWGTAAACSACIAGGANILRVHDVKPMLDVIRVADAIWKTPYA